MHYLPLPRRFRRPLLFPPGLLALAWLLCLGCAAVPQMRGMEPKRMILSIRIPKRGICDQFISNYLLVPKGFQFVEPFCNQQKELDSLFRSNGLNLFLSGQLWQDYFHCRLANSLANQPTNRDIYIRLYSPRLTTYTHFVQFLDLMGVNDLEHYWSEMLLDSLVIHIVNLNRYYITDTNMPTIAPVLGCKVYPISDEDERQSHIVFIFLEKLSILISPNWRNSTLLLLLMSLLSFWQLRRRL